MHVAYLFNLIFCQSLFQADCLFLCVMVSDKVSQRDKGQSDDESTVSLRILNAFLKTRLNEIFEWDTFKIITQFSPVETSLTSIHNRYRHYWISSSRPCEDLRSELEKVWLYYICLFITHALKQDYQSQNWSFQNANSQEMVTIGSSERVMWWSSCYSAEGLLMPDLESKIDYNHKRVLWNTEQHWLLFSAGKMLQKL